MNLQPHFVDVAAVQREFPDARQLPTPERDRLLAFWAEVGAAAKRHGYGDLWDLVTALNHMTAVLVAGDERLEKTRRKKLARETVQQLRSAMNLVLKHGLFVHPKTRGSA